MTGAPGDGAVRASWLIPARNAEATVGDAVRSVLADASADDEVVVVDDGSADRTGEAVRAVADRRVRLLHRPPTGIVGALNAGLDACRGTYVLRMDADDLVVAGRAAAELAVLEDERVGAVDGRVTLFRDGEDVPDGMRRWADWINGLDAPGAIDREILVESPLVHPATAMRRSTLLAAGGWRDGAFPEDYDLWLRLHASGLQLRKVSSVVLRMRDRPERLTRTDPRYGKEAMRAVRRAWLSATALARRRRIVVIGAGKEGGAWIRWLRDAGHDVVAALDVSVRRVGGTKGGVPVLPTTALADVDAEIGLACAAALGARDEIRADVARLRPGWVEGRDWWAVR